MQTRLITTKDELIAIKEEWNTLVTNNPSTDYAFYSWEWFYYSWIYAGSPELFVVIAEDEGRIVGILPLLRFVTKKHGLTLRELGFCPNGNTPRNDIYTSSDKAGTEDEIINAIFNHLFAVKKQWDMIQLANIMESTILHSMLTRSKGHMNPYRFVIQEPGRTSPFVAVNEFANFDDYLLKVLQPRRRTQIRRDIKRLDETKKPWSVKHYISQEMYAEGLDFLIQVRGKSWKSVPSPEFVGFFKSICQSPALSGKIHIAVLLLDEIPIAVQFFLIDKGFAYLCLIDHDVDFHTSLTPGSNLTTMMLKYAFEQNWKCYSFAGSAYIYKSRLASGFTNHSNFQIFHPGLKSRMIHYGKTTILPWIRKTFYKTPAESPENQPDAADE